MVVGLFSINVPYETEKLSMNRALGDTYTRLKSDIEMYFLFCMGLMNQFLKECKFLNVESLLSLNPLIASLKSGDP